MQIEGNKRFSCDVWKSENMKITRKRTNLASTEEITDSAPQGVKYAFFSTGKWPIREQSSTIEKANRTSILGFSDLRKLIN